MKEHWNGKKVVERELIEIGESREDLFQLNHLLKNRFGLTLWRKSRVGWILSGFLTGAPVYSKFFLGLGHVEELFNNPITKTRALIKCFLGENNNG